VKIVRMFAGSAAVVGAAALLAAGGANPAFAKKQEAAKDQEAKKTGPPAYKSAWKMDLPIGTQRVAVADVTGDKKLRLLVLDDKGTLAIHKLSDAKTEETKTEKEGEIALGKDAAKFAVGRFAKDKPALIVVPGALFYRDGDKYSKKEVADLENLSGSVLFSDGTECLFTLGQNGPPTSYGVDLTAEKLLTPGKPMPEPNATAGVYREIVVQLPPNMLQDGPFPDAIKQGALVRLQDIRNDKNLYGVVAWQTAEGPFVAIIGASDLFPMPNSDTKPVWKSPKLAGKVLDIAFGPNPRNTKQTGLFVLQAGGEGGKKPLVEFFSLE
jgi:hypothetical protein